MSAQPLFQALARRRPDEVIFAGADGDWPAHRVRREIATQAERLADCQVLAILADNSPHWAIHDLAALKAGVVVLPLPHFFSDTQLVHALEHSGADTLVTDQPRRILDLNLSFQAGERQGPLVWLRRQVEAVPLPASTAKISFTSGSTGAPKGVCLSAAGLLATAMALHERLADIEIQRHLAVLPLALLLENVAGLYTALLRGAEFQLPPLASLGWRGMAAFDPSALHLLVARMRPRSLILVPELLKAWSLFLARSWQKAPPDLAYVAVGGSRVEASLLHQARQLGLPAYQGYGLTECGSVVSLNRPGDEGEGVGRPLAQARVMIRAGEIQVTTPALVGYLGEPPFAGPEYPTGDLGHLDDLGHLHLSGRRNNLLITSFGRNISPEWVEAALLARPQIAQAVVAGDGQPHLAALLVPAPGQEDADLDRAVRQANRTLPDYARIRNWLRAAPFSQQNGLLTGNGRPVRAAILNHHATALAALYRQPREQDTQESPHVVL